MKQHAIIPIFIPNMGCMESCVFCDQKLITARSKPPTADDVKTTVDTWLSTLSTGDVSGPEIEIAFYGGSFTLIPESMQNNYLSVAKEYVDKGIVSGLHISTRPDGIDDEVLSRLRSYGVRVIELGVQSFDDNILSLSKRGHDSETVRKACKLIKRYGFSLGIQLMVGLPGDSMESCVFSAEETVKMKPDLARIYPTLVLDETELMDMYRSGTYIPLSRKEALERTRGIYEILDSAGIYIMRVGLKSTDIINNDNLGEINQGAYHPAFRQLVESEIARDRVKKLLSSLRPKDTDNRIINILTSPSWLSNTVGQNGENRKFFQDMLPGSNIIISERETISPGEFEIEIL